MYLLPLVLKHQREVEQDLADIGVDFRDFFLPSGGPSRLTTRRLLTLVDGFSKFSTRFWSAIADRDALSEDTIVLTDIFSSLTGTEHKLRTQREDAEKRAELEDRKRRMREWDRWRRRAQAARKRKRANPM
ncbi:hypothetical protein CIP107580_01799 [Corynebacterium diphtheriae]|nr:hypothetical protein B1A65_09460 [Corynebacterium diphtheriae]CAB0574189.1 hypothetical protein CIP107533_01821 [Corynebacterium diphtheriae]CAB0575903.1 hypothetical protein CIP107532_01956 [Corynebacterium diphtheriae]CAB0660209.1 hypothetical protein CIP107562_01778 [Corynebacterium diphtheriae]CAB0660979.1 hypothetical protein CIP107580_01799 [Corynebacterium diphtheriae]